MNLQHWQSYDSAVQSSSSFEHAHNSPNVFEESTEVRFGSTGGRAGKYSPTFIYEIQEIDELCIDCDSAEFGGALRSVYHSVKSFVF